ncbi:uncharacterized protein BO97DRAFT_437159 [Aspergillus homomorphus CBS 101889]|uniref:Rhodopsin domain-containing protein n=1 Tax=Aspergillus homomorphus (strain CBS 101889) TaxID=1450537 RepID=A0A395HMD4_ASPHC|nr:hypothetical protein BO97DRAFT_437159 [Aspergillus homomorphus CBS 101889]RAL09102.1 hypothetical protein BO97DRAFT_437159 [Aspergillus homomorphus CBS 101889]
MASFDTDVDFNESRAAEINAVGWVFIGIAIVAVALGWDDFFIFFSMVSTEPHCCGVVSYAVTLGLGRHTAAVVADHGMDRVILTAKWQIIAFRAFSFPNISIAILITHLLDPNPLRTRCLYGMVTMQVVFAIISVFIVFFQCRPTQKLWNSALDGHCWDASVFDDFQYWVSAYTTVTDVVLAVVPISVFWKLQMRSSTKVGVCIMMGLTLLSAVVTLVKAVYLHLFTYHIDPLYNVVPLVIWELIEQNVVIVAACIPTLRPFFRRAFGSNTTSSYPYSGSTYKLSTTPKPTASMRLQSESESQLAPDYPSEQESKGGGFDHEIWRTHQVHVSVQPNHTAHDT